MGQREEGRGERRGDWKEVKKDAEMFPRQTRYHMYIVRVCFFYGVGESSRYTAVVLD